jgi:hypothetical protein
MHAHQLHLRLGDREAKNRGIALSCQVKLQDISEESTQDLRLGQAAINEDDLLVVEIEEARSS